jgi:hypothetical protein
MRHPDQRALRDQVNFLRRQFLQDGDLPFTDVLTEGMIKRALATLTGWLDRVFSPLVTLWVFLGQVLSADHPCRAAVARLRAHRLARGQRPCSAQTRGRCGRVRVPGLVVACSGHLDLRAQAEVLSALRPDTPRFAVAPALPRGGHAHGGDAAARPSTRRTLVALQCGLLPRLDPPTYSVSDARPSNLHQRP